MVHVGRNAKILKGVAAGLCVFELGALGTGRYPTVSALSHKFWLVEAALIGAFLLDVHHLQKHIAARP